MEFYAPHNDKIICNLCRYNCKLANGQVGYCSVNKNVNNKLENMVYGYLSAVNIDPIEKKPLYHFLPNTQSLSIGTVGCNFKCPFCQNWSISQNNTIEMDNYYTCEEIVSIAKIGGCKSISFTYNEPTIFYPYAKDIANIAHSNDIKTVFVSNGYQSKEMIQDFFGVIDAINVDLKSFDENYYKRVLKGKLSFVLENLILLKQENIWLEITTLVIPNINDSDKMLRDMAKFIYKNLGASTPWHLSAFHPDYKMTNHKNTSEASLIKAYDIAKQEGLEYVYIGNTSLSLATKCPKCGNELITRNGYKILSNTIIDKKCTNCNNIIDGVFNDKTS